MITINPLLRRLQAMSRIKGFIFDCDGVLFDSREANRRYYNHILERMDLEPMDGAQDEYVHSHSVHDSIARIVPKKRLAEAHAIRSSIPYERFFEYMLPEPGLYELLSAIRDLGYRQAVNTNRTTTMDLLLERYELGRFFCPVITAGKVARPKPHPESLHLILDTWKAAPEEVVFIGDSAVDARAALDAGVEFWAYKNETLHASFLIPDFWSMLQFLLHNNGAAVKFRSPTR
jgi:phosphoglycolate phosphatase